MNVFFHALIAAAFALMLVVPEARGSVAGLEEVLELPTGVKVLAAEGFRASDPEDAEWLGALGWSDGAAALVSWETALLTLEAEGPRTLRLFHSIGGANTGGYTWVRLDGRKVREYNYQQGDATDVVVPAGKHHIDLITYATPMLLHRVVELRPGLPVLEQPELTLPDSAEVHLRLRAVSDSPVTWAAENLPEGLVLDADGLLHGTAPERSLRAWVTMTNAVGSQWEVVNLFRMQWMGEVAHGLPLAARESAGIPCR